MSCLLCDQPFGQNTITLKCGHTFDKTCLKQDFLNKLELLEPCACPICLKLYNPTPLTHNAYIPNIYEQTLRIDKINSWVRERARELDNEHGREHPPNKYSKESMDEARLMGKQLIKQRIKEKEEQQEELVKQQQIENQVLRRKQIETEELIQEQQELIRDQQIENQVLRRQQIEREALIRDQQIENQVLRRQQIEKEELIQKLSRQEQYYNTFEKLKGKNRKPVYFE
jgi:hypothetical protein